MIRFSTLNLLAYIIVEKNFLQENAINGKNKGCRLERRRSQVAKAVVCKTIIRGFDSHRRLHILFVHP